MSDKELWIKARAEGRAASPGDQNPYAGTGIPANMWRQGYRSMLLERLTTSPARQAFLNAAE